MQRSYLKRFLQYQHFLECLAETFDSVELFFYFLWKASFSVAKEISIKWLRPPFHDTFFHFISDLGLMYTETLCLVLRKIRLYFNTRAHCAVREMNRRLGKLIKKSRFELILDSTVQTALDWKIQGVFTWKHGNGVKHCGLVRSCLNKQPTQYETKMVSC